MRIYVLRICSYLVCTLQKKNYPQYNMTVEVFPVFSCYRELTEIIPTCLRIALSKAGNTVLYTPLEIGKIEKYMCLSLRNS